jgi:hypothetical protein
MLTFAVAVGPDIEHVGATSVPLNVLRDRLSVAINENLNASVKKRRWVA